MQKSNKTLQNINTIIFDMDGVVVDSGPIWNDANKEFFAQFGIEYKFDLNVINKLNGKSPVDAIKVWQEHYGIKGDARKQAQQRSEMLAKRMQGNLKYIIGFEEFAKTILKKGLKTAIATGSDYYLLSKIKEILNLEDYFGEHIYSVEDVNFISKPDPATFLFAAKKLETNPQDCAVIEDSPLGITAANSCGMYSIGFRNGEDVGFENANLSVEDYQELAKHL